jgi:hypothetical protein
MIHTRPRTNAATPDGRRPRPPRLLQDRVAVDHSVYNCPWPPRSGRPAAAVHPGLKRLTLRSEARGELTGPAEAVLATELLFVPLSMLRTRVEVVASICIAQRQAVRDAQSLRSSAFSSVARSTAPILGGALR